MKKLLLILFLLENIVFAQEQLGEHLELETTERRCSKCGTVAYSRLAMSCEQCNSSLEELPKKEYDSEYASFKVRLMYTGNKPKDLPKYAKLYVNEKYIGNIEQTEIQARNSELDQKWNDGLGGLYTAIYEQNYNKVAPGLKNITIEMRFPRMGGLLKSNKKANFEYVNFKGGKETVINHYFNSATTFTQHKNPEELNNKNKIKIIPEIPDAKIVTGEGTIGVDIGL